MQGVDAGQPRNSLTLSNNFAGLGYQDQKSGAQEKKRRKKQKTIAKDDPFSDYKTFDRIINLFTQEQILTP